MTVERNHAMILAFVLVFLIGSKKMASYYSNDLK